MYKVRSLSFISIAALALSLVSCFGAAAQDRDTVIFQPKGGSDTINIRKSVKWSVSKTPEWCMAYKLDDTSLVVYVDAWRMAEPREGDVVCKVSGRSRRIHVRQNEKVDNYADVTFRVTPGNAHVSIPELGLEGAGDSTFRVKEGNWTAYVSKEGCDTSTVKVRVPEFDPSPIFLDVDLVRQYCMAMFNCSPANDQLSFTRAPLFVVDGREIDVLADAAHSFDDPGPVHYYEVYDGNVVPIPVGEHTVEVSADGFIPKTVNFKSESGVLSTVDFRLTARVGSITITDGGDAFYATVFVDGINFANVPFHQETITSGEHIITFDKSGLVAVPETLKVSIVEGQDYEYQVTMLPYDTYSIRPSQEGAEVWIDDRLMGTSPCENVRVPAGSRRLRIVKEGCFTCDTTLNVVDGGGDYIITPFIHPSSGINITTSIDRKKWASDVRLRFIHGDEVVLDTLGTPANLQIPSDYDKYTVVAYRNGTEKYGLNNCVGRRTFKFREGRRDEVKIRANSRYTLEILEGNARYSSCFCMDLSLLKFKVFPGFSTSLVKYLSGDAFYDECLTVAGLNGEMRVGGAISHTVDISILGSYAYYPENHDFLDQERTLDFFGGAEVSTRFRVATLFFKAGYSYMSYKNYYGKEMTDYSGISVSVGLSLGISTGRNILRIF